MKNKILCVWLLNTLILTLLFITGITIHAQETITTSTVIQDPVQDIASTYTLSQIPESEDVSDEDGMRFNFRGVPLDTFLDHMSRAAGFVIIRNTDITGRVDVVSHQPLTKDEAVNLLNTILNEKGYTAIRNDRILTIVKRDEAKTRYLPVKKGNNPEDIPMSDEMVTQIIPVKYGDALRIVENIESLLPSYATITANESSNAIILTDTQTNVRRIAEIIQALDTSISEVSTLKVFALEHADAKEIADLINEIFENQGSGSSNSDRRNRIREFMSRMRGFGPPR
jgi:general secretion pathway protein D